jgi:energy-coupling factor transporter ATP-binding protein EcfA2
MNSANSKITDPYIGLRSFKQNDSELFFGRENQTNEMLMRLEAQKDFRFLAVLGASGSGKSSLVMAGLLPALSHGFLFDVEAPGDWEYVTARPGGAPLQNLANAWCDTFHPQSSSSDEGEYGRRDFAAAQLRSGPLGIVRAYRGEKKAQGCPVLILIDQFEELFRFTGREQSGLSTNDSNQAKLVDKSNSTTNKALIEEQRRNEAAAFVELLLTTAQQTDVPIYIVITMRSDFLGHCDAFQGLPEAISRSQYLTPRMTRAQLSEAIRRPLESLDLGASIDETLVNQILNDVGTNPDQLPLMQHVLMRTWCEALKRKKNEILNSLESDQERRIAQRLFNCLRDIPAEGPTQRKVKLGEVAAEANADADAVIKVIRVFQNEGNNFIMASSQGELTAESELDINEKALLHVGQKLVLEDYKNAKELSGALSEHLNEVLNSLKSDRELRITQQLFICLSDEPANGPLTRRIAKLGEVAAVAIADTHEVIKVVRVFQKEGNNFIMASPQGDLTAESELDISHETLLRQWDKAKQWLAQEAEAVRQYRRLIDKVEQKNKLSEIELVQAEEWSKTPRTPTWTMRYDNAQTPEESKLPACLKLIKDSKLEAEFARKFLIVPLIICFLFLGLFLDEVLDFGQKTITAEYQMSSNVQTELRDKHIVALPKAHFIDVEEIIESSNGKKPAAALKAYFYDFNSVSDAEELSKEVSPLLTKSGNGKLSKYDVPHLEKALETKFLKLPYAIILNNSNTFEQKTGPGVGRGSGLEQLSEKVHEDLKKKGINPLPETIFVVKQSDFGGAAPRLVEILENAGIIIVPDKYLEPITSSPLVDLYALPNTFDVVSSKQSAPVKLALDIPYFGEYLLKYPQKLKDGHYGARFLIHVVLGVVLLFIVEKVCHWLVFEFFQSPGGIISISITLLLFSLILLSVGLFSFVQADRAEASMLISGVPAGTLLFLLTPVRALIEEPWANRFKEVQGFLLKLYGFYALTGSLFLFMTSSQIEYGWEPGLLLVKNPWVLFIAAFVLFFLGKKKCALAQETFALQSDQGNCHKPLAFVNSQTRLYSDRAIVVTSFFWFGLGLPAGVMMFRNLWCVGRRRAASLGLVIPFIPFIAPFGYLMVLLKNEQAFEFEVGPLLFMALLSSPYVTNWLWLRLSGREIRQHIDHKGALQPFWKVLSVLILFGYIGMSLFGMAISLI